MADVLNRPGRAFFAEWRTVFARVEKSVSGVPGGKGDGGPRRLFTLRLLTRLLFLYFIEKKGWLSLDGDRRYLRALFNAAQSGGEDFLNDRLYGAFFHGLNNPSEVGQPFCHPDRIGLRGKVGDPAGGPFEVEDSYDMPGRVTIPNERLGEVIDLFERYNFTVAESTPLDAEVAVSPEMLSKVVEDWASGRHRAGRYYTPRGIVSFLCRESLKLYLARTVSMLEASRFVDEASPAMVSNQEAVLDALHKIRICDPACGSGAFLLGMMQELLRLRSALSSKHDDHGIKRSILETNLHGMDLDPLAVNIARLRLWLSLAADADADRPEETLYLPHLNGKIKNGDSILNPNCEGGFDIVLTNPPWVRQELIADMKLRLKTMYREVYDGAADLYVYFYARALQLLGERGVLCILSPNKFFRSGYGANLRQYLAAQSTLHLIVDFQECPLFQAVTYPAIVLTQKAPIHAANETPRVCAYSWQASDDPNLIQDILRDRGLLVPQRSFTSQAWPIQRRAVRRLLDRIEAAGRPLRELVAGRLYYGIKTGCNAAFEIDENTRRALIAEDSRSAEIIRPWLRGRHVRRWCVAWGGKYLLCMRRGIEIERYPAVARYLEEFRSELEPRPRDVPSQNWRGRKTGGYRWYELQDTVAYWAEFDRPKIVYQVIATAQQFAFTNEPLVSNDKTWIIPEPPAGLLGILNSRVAWFFLDQVAPKLQGGAFELRSPFMSQLPIAAPTPEVIATVAALQQLPGQGKDATPQARTLESDLEEIVYRLYGLSQDDRKVLEETVPSAPLTKRG